MLTRQDDALRAREVGWAIRGMTDDHREAWSLRFVRRHWGSRYPRDRAAPHSPNHTDHLKVGIVLNSNRGEPPIRLRLVKSKRVNADGRRRLSEKQVAPDWPCG